MMKILWLTNIPSPYRVDFFNELGKLCDLTVLFERAASAERDDSWKKFQTENFKAVFLKGKKFGVAEAFCPSVRKYLKKHVYDHIVVTNFSDPTGMLAIAYMKRKRIPYAIESDGAFAGSGRGVKERIKKYFLSGAELYFSTAEEHEKYYLTYGAPKGKLVRYPFSSLRDRDILCAPVSFDEKARLKKELGINEEKVILAVGQFIPRKGFDLLIQAMATLPKEIGCYIVGGKAPEEYWQLTKRLATSNVHFVDFKEKEELKKYYRAADVFVHPTREDIWGLVVNEAMAQGLPVVATDRCIAALELVENGKNGYVIPTENVGALKEKLATLLEDGDLRASMNEESLRAIRRYTVEEMAKFHMNIWLSSKEAHFWKEPTLKL